MYLKFFIIALVTFLSSALAAQVIMPDTTTADTMGQKRVTIHRADRSVIIQEKEREIVHLNGNIELNQDSIYMYCDSAVIIDKKEVQAFGNIIIQQGDSLNVFSDSLYYDSQTKMALLKGEVVLDATNEQIWTEELEYDLQSKLAFFMKGATLLNDSTQLTSEIGYYWVETDEAKFIKDVVVIHPDFNLRADSMRYNTAFQLATFIGPTIIEQDSSLIYCTEGYYDIANSYAVFSRDVRYLSGAKKASANQIVYDGSEAVIRMEGNARYFENDQIVSADTILYFESSGDTRLIGNANFKDSTRQVTGNEILYNQRTEQLQTIGRSEIEEGSQQLVADNIQFDNTSGIGHAVGDVIWIDTSAKYSIISEEAYYNKKTSFVKAFGKQRPLMKSLIDQDTLYLAADTLIMQMSAVRDTAGVETGDSIQQMIAYPDVRFFKSNMQGLCDSLAYSSRDSTFQFIGDPVVWSDTTQFTADTILMLLMNGKVDRFLLRENGFIVNTLSPQLHNQVKGKYITAFFEQDAIHHMLVEGNAESIYFVQDDDDAFIGANQSICSEILILFDSTEIDEIKFLTKPNSKMIPITQINPSELRLPGFQLRKNRPESVADLFNFEILR